ncbi:MAG TPA: sugar ABC transporter substrate-binding protein [Limnochordia bacterium]
MRNRLTVGVVVALVTLAQGSISAAAAQITVMGTGFVDRWQQVLDAFTAANPDIDVSYLKIDGGQTLERTVVMSAGGSPPDVVLQMLGSEYIPLASTGLLYDITRSVDAAYLAAFYPGPLDFSYYQGRLYGLPTVTGTMGIYYNKDMFSNAGIGSIPLDYDWTDFLSYAQKTTKADPEGRVTQWGFSLYQYIRDYMNFVWTNGGALMSPDRTRFTLNSPAAVEALQFVADLALEHQVSPTRAVYSTTAAWTLWYEGSAAMYPCGSWCVGSSRERNQFNWDVTTFPTRKQYTVVNEPFISGVASGSRKPTEAVRFLKWLAHDEQAQRILAEIGEGIPINKAIANAYFPDPRTPQHEEVFLAMLNSGLPRIMPYTPNWRDINDAVNSAMVEVFAGTTPARQAMDELQPVIDGLLQRPPA